MVNQTQFRLEDVSIFCEMKRNELAVKNNFKSLTIADINSFDKYVEKYGDFITYLMQKNC